MYVEDVNDEAPVFTQQQYSRLALRETAGIGTSVIVVRATDRDTGEARRGSQGAPFPRMTLLSLSFLLLWSLSSLGLSGSPFSVFQTKEGLLGQSRWHPHQMPRPRRTGVRESCLNLWMERGEATSLRSPALSLQDSAAPS